MVVNRAKVVNLSATGRHECAHGNRSVRTGGLFDIGQGIDFVDRESVTRVKRALEGGHFAYVGGLLPEEVETRVGHASLGIVEQV